MRMRYSIIAALALSLAAPPAHAGTGFSAHLDGFQEPALICPSGPSSGTGLGYFVLDDFHHLSCSTTYSGLLGTPSLSHIHKGAIGVAGGVVLGFSSPISPIIQVFTLTAAQEADLNAGLYYINVHSSFCPSGEIRGQILPDPTPTHGASWGRLKILYR